MTQLPLLTDADHEELLAILAFAASQAVACAEQGDSPATGPEDEAEWCAGCSLAAEEWWAQLDSDEAWISKFEAERENDDLNLNTEEIEHD